MVYIIYLLSTTKHWLGNGYISFTLKQINSWHLTLARQIIYLLNVFGPSTGAVAIFSPVSQ